MIHQEVNSHSTYSSPLYKSVMPNIQLVFRKCLTYIWADLLLVMKQQ